MIAAALVVALSAAAAAPLTASDAELVSSLVAAAATKDERLDVLSAADVRNAVDLEAQRAVMGCDATSCLLEVAGAMDARLVVHGTLGTLGDVVILTLNVFDTGAARALGRVVVQRDRVEKLGEAVPPAVVELLERAPTPTPGTRVRTVVLDVKLSGPDASSSQASKASSAPRGEPDSFPWLAAGALGVGAVGLGVGVVADALAVSDTSSLTSTSSVDDAQDVANRRANLFVPMALVGYASALVGVATGVVLFALGDDP